MAKGKLEKFDDLENMPHVFQNFKWLDPKLLNHKKEVVDYRAKWGSDVFKNNHPIILELACGYGEYTMAMAESLPDKNIIGIDIKGNRIWTGANFVQEKGLSNAIFIRSAIELLENFFGPSEVSEIWIPFADPHVRDSKSKKRLTGPKFIQLYRYLAGKEGIVHLKTDSDLLYDFTLQVIESEGCTILENYRDLYNSDFTNELLRVKTRYEKLNISKSDRVKYVKFRLQ